jgi:hypothetical protein
MVAEPITRSLSLDEAVLAVYEAAVAGAAVAETASEYAHLVDDRDVHEAIVIGIGELVHRRLARRRRGGDADAVGDGVETTSESESAAGPDSDHKTAKAKPHAALRVWDATLDDNNYEAADGTRKALRGFGLDDSIKLRDLAGAKADGHIRIRDAMDIAAAALRRTGKATIGDAINDRRRVVEALA